MNDCLAATGSAVGLDPLVGALVLLLLGAGLAALAWRHRKRAAAGIALLPLALGVFLFSGLSGQPAQAAPCPPPAACVPMTVLEDVLIDEDVSIEFFETELGAGTSLDMTDAQWDEFDASFEAAEDAGATITAVLTVANGVGTVVLTLTETGIVVSGDPALPADFTAGDVYDLIINTLDTIDTVPATLVITFAYNNGCADAVATTTVEGEIILGTN